MSASFPNLFSPLEVGPIQINNRIFSTANIVILAGLVKIVCRDGEEKLP